MKTKSFKERYWKFKIYETGLWCSSFLITLMFISSSTLLENNDFNLEVFLQIMGAIFTSLFSYYVFKAILYLIIILVRGLCKIMREGAK